MPGPEERREPSRFALEPRRRRNELRRDGDGDALARRPVGARPGARVDAPAPPAARRRAREPARARSRRRADFGNGVSAVAAVRAATLFINADLHIHLHREPRGEWIGLDARTLLHAGGTALAESVLHDLDGPVGRAFQTLVVQAR